MKLNLRKARIKNLLIKMENIFVLCINNMHYESSLEQRKIYQAFQNDFIKKNGLIRVVDETGEDYLYPAEFFVPITIPKEAENIFRKNNN